MPAVSLNPNFKTYVAIFCLVSMFSTRSLLASDLSACLPQPAAAKSIAALCVEKLQKLSRSLLNRPRLRTSADYLTQTSPPIRALVTAPDGHQYCATQDEFHDPPDILRFMAIADLYKLVSSDEFATSVAEHYIASIPNRAADYTVERATIHLRNDAAILLSRFEMPNPRSGEIVSAEMFARQAALIRAQVEPVPEMFRFDLRSPEDVKKQNGFRPNPNKRPFTIVESISGHIRGGGNTVSATLQTGNSHILSLVLSALSYDPHEIDDSPFDSRVLTIYEYEVKNSMGFVTPDDFGMSTEKEVVTRYIPLANITRYRIHQVRATSRYQTELLSTSQWHNF